jgi:hypothetical protein
VSSRNAELSPILLRISIEKLEPLTGSATLGDGERVWFEGWLGLLSVLSELVNSVRQTCDE